MTSPLQETADLEHFIKYEDGFNQPSINKRSIHYIFSMFLGLWAWPFLMKLTRKLSVKRAKEDNFITMDKKE